MARWTPTDTAKDLQLRATVKVCSDGRRRNCVRALSPQERLQRFHSCYVKQPSGCWQWIASLSGSCSAYGVISHNGRQTYAHRFSYETFVGPIPDGLIVRHLCDNPLCVNPAHLLTGTHADNTHDKVTRNRHRYGINKGSSNGKTIITPSQAERVVELRRSGHTLPQIAALTGVSRTNCSAICTGRSWSHLTGITSPLT